MRSMSSNYAGGKKRKKTRSGDFQSSTLLSLLFTLLTSTVLAVYINHHMELLILLASRFLRHQLASTLLRSPSRFTSCTTILARCMLFEIYAAEVMGCGFQASAMNLPPGFRFHPTDEELITHYLAPKVADSGAGAVIGELDFHKFEPWDLPLSAKLGEEWYFFCIKDRKYPTGLRTNRATDSGYWKATGKDKEVRRRKSLIGMKKTLVFYKGRAPKGEKTDWVMHEYRVEGNCRSRLDNVWVICRVFCRRSSRERKEIEMMVDMGSCFQDELSSGALLPSADGDQNKNKSFSLPDAIHVACFSNCLVGLDGSEELANSYDSPLLTNGDLHFQGDGSIRLFEDYDPGSGKEVLGSNFNHQVLLSDADVLSWN